MHFFVSNSSGKSTSSKNIPISDSNFTHIVGTFDGSSIKIYKNGDFFQNIKFNGNYSPDPRLPLHLGSASYCSSCEMWAGDIDDIRLYNKTITESEVKSLSFINSTNSVLDGLVGYWKLDGNLDDKSTYNNHGKMFTPISSMAFAPNGKLFFTEKNTGKIKILINNHVLEKPFVSIPNAYISWEEGLLGLTIDPQFEKNHYIYLYYTTIKDKEPFNRVVRFTEANNATTNMIVLLDNIPPPL